MFYAGHQALDSRWCPASGRFRRRALDVFGRLGARTVPGPSIMGLEEMPPQQDPSKTHPYIGQYASPMEYQCQGILLSSSHVSLPLQHVSFLHASY